MEHTLRGCHWDFSTHFNVDWEIDFTSQCWSFHVDYSDSFHSFDTSARFNHVYQILSLTWLTDKNHCFLRNNVAFKKLSGIVVTDFFKCFKFFEIILRSKCRIVGRSTCNECEIIIEGYCLNSFKLRLKLNLTLLRDFITVEWFVRFWWSSHDACLILLRNMNKPTLLLDFALDLLNSWNLQFPNFSISSYKKAICLFLECNRFRSNKELLIVHSD